MKYVKDWDLEMNGDKSRVVVLREEEGCVCEVDGDWKQLEHVVEFKYLEFVSVLDQNGKECWK